MNKNVLIEKLKLQPLTEEEKASRHILKRLAGPIATYKDNTRNDRHYNKELWEKAIKDDIFQEKLENKSLFLELGHPEDRTEIDMEKVCACIPEMPHIENDGDLIAYVDVLDTPNGKILNTLIDYGFIPGISSRGTGDVIENEVDPDTFMLETWDIVCTPSVKKARLQVVESLQGNKTLKTALTESLNQAEGKDKKIMLEAINNLGISISDDDNIHTTETSTPTTVEEAIDDGAEKVMKSLQEALVSKSELERKVKELQQKLAVSDAKVNELTEEVERYKSSTTRLTEMYQAKPDNTEVVSSLEEEVKRKDRLIEGLKSRCSNLVEKSKTGREDIVNLTESIKVKDAEIVKLNESIATIKTEYEGKLTKLTEEHKSETTKLNESIEDLKEAKNKQTKLAKSYERLTEQVVDRYIESKAVMLGVSSQEIKNRLNEEYTLDDIDKICKELQDYSVNMSKLPFKLDGKTRVKITESKKPKLPSNDDADEVDDSLIRLAKLNK